MKQMACVLSDDEVEEKCVCTVCKKVHFISRDADDYFDYAENGPFVGRYNGWDDATEIICDDCYDLAEQHFGKGVVFPLLFSGELPLVDFYAGVARSINLADPASR